MRFFVIFKNSGFLIDRNIFNSHNQLKKHVYENKKSECQIYRSSRTEVFCKNVCLEISQNSQEKTCARVSFFNKVAVSGLQLY